MKSSFMNLDRLHKPTNQELIVYGCDVVLSKLAKAGFACDWIGQQELG